MDEELLTHSFNPRVRITTEINSIIVFKNSIITNISYSLPITNTVGLHCKKDITHPPIIFLSLIIYCVVFQQLDIVALTSLKVNRFS